MLAIALNLVVLALVVVLLIVLVRWIVSIAGLPEPVGQVLMLLIAILAVIYLARLFAFF